MRRWLAPTLAAAAMAAAALVGARYLLPAGGTADATAQEQRVPIGGPFTLTDQTGRQVTEQDFRGRYMLVYFGYTYCPDICPLGLEKVAQAMDLLPAAQQQQVVPAFITVDPQRDTVEVMRDYVGRFDPRLVGLTGSEDEVQEVTKAWRVYVQKGEEKDGAYLVDHSTFTFLMGPDGEYVTHFGHAATAEEMAQRIAQSVPAG
jgi:cytochrome oxidase Cu insertion factor (SCO1/SenC/PrrC family)